MNRKHALPAPWRRLAARIAARLALGAALAGAGSAALAADEALRDQVARPLQAVQELLKDGRAQEALARLTEVDAIEGLSAYEKFIVERLRVVAAVGSQDTPRAIRSMVLVLEANRLPAAEQLPMNEALVASCFSAKDFACVERWAKRYEEDGGGKRDVALRRAQAAYLSGAYPLGAEIAAKLAADDVKAGRKAPLDVLQLQASCLVKSGNMAAYRVVLEQLASDYPTSEYWSNLVYGLMQQPGFPKKLELDGYRLLLAAQALSGGDEYLDMGEAAIKAGFPTEAARVLDKGEVAGLFTSAGDKARHQEMRGRLAKLIADDQKAMTQTDAMLAKAKDGNLHVGLGMNLVLSGQASRGLAMIKQGLEKGVGAGADEARLHLAYAQWAAGNRPQALDGFRGTFAPGPVAELARYWTRLPAP